MAFAKLPPWINGSPILVVVLALCVLLSSDIVNTIHIYRKYCRTHFCSSLCPFFLTSPNEALAQLGSMDHTFEVLVVQALCSLICHIVKLDTKTIETSKDLFPFKDFDDVANVS